MYIPEATDYRFAYDTAHICIVGDELRVHSQANSRTYQLYMYAWEHVYCLMPSAKGKRKRGTGWVAPNARDTMDDPEFGTTWHSNDLSGFIKAAHNAHS
jgi:hypothetical protein